MTTVPDPFRDQLAEALWLAQPEYFVSPWAEISETTRERYRAKVDALLPLIEARVQATANQRAAEELREAALDWPPTWAVDPATYLRDRAAALAQPRPEAER